MTDGPDRRRFVRTVLACGTAALAGCARLSGPRTTQRRVSSTPGSETPSESPTPADDGLPVGLETVVEDVGVPTALAVPDRGTHAYLGTRRGVVHVVGSGQRRADPLLDLRETVVLGGERGLLGIALHPDFGRSRRLFVRFSSPVRPGTPSEFSHTFVLAEFAVDDGGTRADQASERPILELPQPDWLHNAGDLAFGPDGYLYVPTGDGGGYDLGHAEDWYDGTSVGNGQDTSENLLGSILRLDVDSAPTEHPRSDDAAPAEPADGDGGYAVPPDNPLVGREGHLDEHYAWGFRNPWRLSFDGSDLYVADVGASSWESIYRVEAGGNYGWSVREGSHCFKGEGCPAETPPAVRGGEPLLDPVVEYPHPNDSEAEVTGAAVVCGYPYHGATVPELGGEFLFADWRAGGDLFAATPVEDGRWPVEVVPVAEPDRSLLGRVFGIERVGPDEWYVLARSSGGVGGVHRIVPGEEA